MRVYIDVHVLVKNLTVSVKEYSRKDSQCFTSNFTNKLKQSKTREKSAN